MAITEQDIKLLQSERLTDYDDGGGRMTGTEVVDGQVNNLFPDISELDRVIGRVSLRKGFVGVLTDTTDTLYGTHAVITEQAADPLVTVAMFDTGSWTDERADAQNRVESYVISGPESRFVLYGDHPTGMMTLRMYCEADVPDPEVGQVLRLSVEAEGYVPQEQYVRVKQLSDRYEQTFDELVNGTLITFKKDVLLVEITTALEADFAGGTPTRVSRHNSPTLVRTTQVADAARYFSLKALTEPAVTGDLSVKVDSPYAPLVPSTTTETALVDVRAGADRVAMVPSGADATLQWTGTLSSATAPDFAASVYLPRGAAKGSVSVTIGATTLTDDGSGNLYPGAGDASGYAGTVDYETGLVTVTRDVSWSASVSVTATPAAAVTGVAHTQEIQVTLSNRGYNYVPNLKPIPAPGTLIVDYMALGKWVRLRDDGTGTITGRPGEGSGTVDYATGSVSVTLGALPDVGSSILFSWGSPVHYERRDGDATIVPGAIVYTVAQPAIVPGSLTVQWLEGGVTKTASDDGAGGLTGAATGEVSYRTGKIRVQPTQAPDPNSLITVTYDHHDTATGTESVSASGRTYSITMTGAPTPIKPGSVRLQATLHLGAPVPYSKQDEVFVFEDDGAGGLSGEAGTGTIDYATGTATITIADTVTRRVWRIVGWEVPGDYKTAHYGWVSATVSIHLQDPETWAWQVEADDVLTTAQTEQVTHDGVTVDLTPSVTDQVCPGSVRFTWAGHEYVDRSGQMYYDVDPLTNSGTPAGTIDYTTGVVKLTDYVTGANAITVTSLLTVFGQPTVDRLFFRTTGAPLKQQSFSLRVVKADDGVQVSATADVNGALATAEMDGLVLVDTGIVSVRFGAWVDDATLTAEEKAEDWYDPALVQPDGTIWRPLRMINDSAFYNTVVYSYVPLSESDLGLDPVRLPQDGRVPIYRPGDVLVVHNTQEAFDAAPTAGAAVTLRPKIAFAHVYDAGGVPVPSDRFVVDLEAGTLTWADPLDLTGYPAPIRIVHRIEDVVLCSDVQITGELTCVSALTHDYTAGDSWVSSALVIGDMQARVERFFDQQTWTGEWADALIGSAAAANYNTVQYPVEVTNRGAVEERWRLTFDSPNTVHVIGEVYGQILTSASIAGDIAPVNPETGVPYFTIRAAGWGGGWGVGNTIRFNTRAANYPIWFARTTLQGPQTTPTDDFRIQIRGDAD